MRIAIGLDVGSTTVKAVVVDPESRQVLWKRYERHETRQAEKCEDLLVAIGLAFSAAEEVRVYITGSGSGPLAKPLGACFVQEVNAVTLAVEHLHPRAGSVIELGGQDAKIILFRERTGEDGRVEKQALTSMNDKCASGTGATIDKCFLKVGYANEAVARVRFDPGKLHHVAAKCGVFAETDIVNLVKSGIPGDEILNSLADAIVQQNLSVLTRGNTLRPEVILLGGPHTFLPFLVDCWRLRIPETWDQRGFAWPREVPLDELIRVPQDSQYYAALGAVLFGLTDAAAREQGRYLGLDGLRAYRNTGRQERLAGQAAAPLVRTSEELTDFAEAYRVPAFVPARFTPGQRVRAVVGLDGGSTSSKAVLVDHETGEVLLKAYRLSKGNPLLDTKELLAELRDRVAAEGATLEVTGFGATGYAAAVLDETLSADANVVETIAHCAAALRYVPNADVICDIGGQDIKVLFLRPSPDGGREVKDFRLSNQCSAGNGMLLQAMADQLGVPLERYAEVAFSAELAPRFSYGCAVFLDADRVNFQKEGFAAPELLAGLAQVLPKNVWQYVVQVPRLAEFGRVFVLQGGTQRNLAAVKAQVDYIRARVPDAEVVVHPHCGEAGAIGAAMEAREHVRREGRSRFVGLESAIGLQYTTRTDEETRCTFCPNHCSRTFVDAVTPEGRKSRYISGFSCEKGTVESKEELKRLQAERNGLRKRFPNLVEEEAELAFRFPSEVPPLPQAGSSKRDVAVDHGLFRIARRALQRGFRRSHADLSGVKIGIPRVLNLYSTAPFFRAYFMTLGMPRENVVFSPPTSEELSAEGMRYGSVDPCFPAKVAQAHIHELLHHAHADRRRGPLSYLFFPSLSHVASGLVGTMDDASCPIVAGTPNVMRAAFTKETDFFARAGIEYLDPTLSLIEPNLLKRRLFELFGPRLGVTEDESDFAVDEGFNALAAFERHLQERGRQILEQVARESRIAVLMIGRPYHSDPGLNHQIPDELQVLGYPILSVRSLPRDPAWLKTFFPDADPLDIRDVWPENYSTNSAQKVWAARFAARHPNVALLDLSSFKCGHDAPTYGIIDRIVGVAKVPYAALHDLDANKPGGSIGIRVRTYAHKLEAVRRELRAADDKRAVLAQRIAEKRRELLEQHRSRALQEAK